MRGPQGVLLVVRTVTATRGKNAEVKAGMGDCG